MTATLMREFSSSLFFFFPFFPFFSSFSFPLFLAFVCPRFVSDLACMRRELLRILLSCSYFPCNACVPSSIESYVSMPVNIK